MADMRSGSDRKMLGIWKVWEAVAGEVIAAHARPEAFKDGLLIVKVAESAWAQQLQFQKKDLIRKVNKALGSELVKDIRFKIGVM